MFLADLIGAESLSGYNCEAILTFIESENDGGYPSSGLCVRWPRRARVTLLIEGLCCFVFFTSQSHDDVTWCQADVSHCKVARKAEKVLKFMWRVNVKCVVLQVPGATNNWPSVSGEGGFRGAITGGGIKRPVLKPYTVF